MEHLGYKSHGNQQFGIENILLPEQYNTALYLRFSRDDGTEYDSSSIESQKMQLEKYCKDNGYKVYDIYSDDGYTGLNFNRPDFQRMIADIEAGKINLVITKDQSRLGRDYIQTGYFVEMHFADYNVRYIAINDGADTSKPENADFMPFRNIINNMYSKDISRKTKSAKRQRALHGLFQHAYAPYGYKKDPNNKNKLIIDEEPAEIVREIFRLAASGEGKNVIARLLTKKGVLVPSAYKAEQGLGGSWIKKRIMSNCDWSYTTVVNILKDRTYVGAVVSRKYETINYKTGRLAVMPKDKHIICEDMHESIITYDVYEKVQQLISAKYMPPVHFTKNIFRGIVFCAECGRRMSLAHKKVKCAGGVIATRTMYRCNFHYRFPTKCEHHNCIYLDKLSEQILTRVKSMFRLVLEDETIVESAAAKIAKEGSREKLFAEKNKIEKRLGVLPPIIRKLFEEYTAQSISVGNYKEFLEDYQKEQDRLSERLVEINIELDKADDYNERIKKLKEIATVYSDYTELTAEMLNELIERIEVRHIERINGKKHQEITITYRFINTTI
ncbi:MAG: recombinase family protein [Firmicutes bacterium]|nr:recombinase family protein [Bacillota bacterium]